MSDATKLAGEAGSRDPTVGLRAVAALRRLLEARWPVSGASDHGVSEAIYLDDPDGIGVELYRDRPREEWARGADGQVIMYTRRLDLEALLAEATEQPPSSPSQADAVEDRRS